MTVLQYSTTTRGVEQMDEQPIDEPAREKLSAFVICYNEEDQIRECLESLSFCDEIVVIDSFSKDRTVEICNEMGAKVIQRPWPGYRAQKAFGLEATAHAWVVNLDADERVSPELRDSILKVLQEEHRQRSDSAMREDAFDGYEISRVVHYLNRWWRKGGWYPEYRVRFFRKSRVTWGGVDPHEKPIVDGKIGRLEGELFHFTYTDMNEQFSRLHAHSTVAALEEYKRGKDATLKHLLVNPFLRILKFYVLKKGYREGRAGLIVAVIEGYYTFMKYAKLWEMRHGANTGKIQFPGEKRSTE